MKSIRTGLVLAMAAATAFGGDQLVVTGKTHEGNFQAYEDGRFQFMTAKGRFVKEQAARVTKLVLGTPQKVTYQAADGQKEETGVFKGYDKKKFTFTAKDGKEVVVPQNRMKTVELTGDETVAAAGNGEVLAGGRYPVPRMDLDAMAGGELTPAQKTALEGFKTAKKAYDDFLSQSTAMVQEMDKLTGARREDLLNKLRVRKGEEQPLKNSLIAAYKALTNVFAEPDEAGAPVVQAEEPAAPAKPAKPAGGRSTITKPKKPGNG